MSSELFDSSLESLEESVSSARLDSRFLADERLLAICCGHLTMARTMNRAPGVIEKKT